MRYYNHASGDDKKSRSNAKNKTVNTVTIKRQDMNGTIRDDVHRNTYESGCMLKGYNLKVWTLAMSLLT